MHSSTCATLVHRTYMHKSNVMCSVTNMCYSNNKQMQLKKNRQATVEKAERRQKGKHTHIHSETHLYTYTNM